MPQHANRRMKPPWSIQRVRIDCGIANLVRLLWKLGLATCQSCEDDAGEVEIGVFDAHTAAWFWACAHVEDNPTGEQLTDYRQQLETLHGTVREQASAEAVAWFRRNIDEVEREIQDDPSPWRQQQLEDLRQQMRYYDQNGTYWESLRGDSHIPAGELRVGPDWRWEIHPCLIYCKFPCSLLPRVEANCEAALSRLRARLKAGQGRPVGKAARVTAGSVD